MVTSVSLDIRKFGLPCCDSFCQSSKAERLLRSWTRLPFIRNSCVCQLLMTIIELLLLLPLALQPTVGFDLSNNVPPFFPICHQLSPSSHFQHLKISFYFHFPSFPVSSPSSRPFQFLSEDLFGHPILLHSL